MYNVFATVFTKLFINIPHELWEKHILIEIQTKELTRLCRSLTKQSRNLTKEFAFDNLQNPPFTESEIKMCIKTASLHGLFTEKQNGNNKFLLGCLYFLLSHKNRVILFSHTSQFGFDVNVKTSLHASKRVKGWPCIWEIDTPEIKREYDLVTTFTILKQRAKNYFEDITSHDIKEHMLNCLKNKLRQTDLIQLVSLRGYLLINCIIMGIQYDDVTEFLQPVAHVASSKKCKSRPCKSRPCKSREGTQLEEKDWIILQTLYDHVVTGINRTCNL
jgi:hypothetical protein